jgi:deazaflavin-dependent oxidoreductase (nitroreductase family)
MSRPWGAAGATRAAHDDPTSRTRGSLPVRLLMGPMTKVLNPLVRAGAGRRHFGMVAQVHHRGRRSGRLYVTPASARVQGDTFWIPLTFGTESDWCRNVRAAGGCRIKWRGIEYSATDPSLVTVDVARREARSAFKGYERLMFRMLRIKHFLRMQLDGEGTQVAPA